MYSWILPIKDEAPSLAQLMREIKAVMGQEPFEIIAVNDGSTDNTTRVLTKLEKHSPQIKPVHFLKPVGKWAALRAGFDKSRGSIIISIDSDLQDDPREVTNLIQYVKQGYDVVSGFRSRRFDPMYKVLLSHLGNRLLRTLGLGNFGDINSPFKVYRRNVLETLHKRGGFVRFSLIYARQLGFNVAEIAVEARPRLYGKSKFGIVKYIQIIWELIVVLYDSNFSTQNRSQCKTLPA